MSLRVGIDLVSVEQVRDSIADHGQNYLHRIYTEVELEQSALAPERLAARFAAKEATLKALGRGQQGFGWQAIAVTRDPAGQPSIELTGEAAELARREGIESIAVSLSHERDHAAALVVMECRS